MFKPELDRFSCFSGIGFFLLFLGGDEAVQINGLTLTATQLI